MAVKTGDHPENPGVVVTKKKLFMSVTGLRGASQQPTLAIIVG